MAKTIKNRNNRHNKSKKRTKRTKRIYSISEFNSGDGMLTSVWGPGIWHYLHTMSFNYPNEPTSKDKHNYKNFVLSLEGVLPCKYCRINLKNNLKKLPLHTKHMKNRESFSRYIYELHELVNTMLHKKSNLSYDDVRERYEHFRARCNIFDDDSIKKSVNTKKENGCTESLYGEKSRCIIKIVPQNNNDINTFQIDNKCIKKRVLE